MGNNQSEPIKSNSNKINKFSRSITPNNMKYNSNKEFNVNSLIRFGLLEDIRNIAYNPVFSIYFFY